MEPTWSVARKIGPNLFPFVLSIFVFFAIHPTESTSSPLCLVTKCLPIIFLCMFVKLQGLTKDFHEHVYSRRIFAGLILSMCGDACLVYKEDYFIHGIISFALSHIVYVTAFGIKPYNFRLAFYMLFIAVPATLIYMPYINNSILKVMVPIYSLLLLLMFWRAMSQLDFFNSWTWPKLCCSLGAFLFVISDSVLSFDMFIVEIPYSHQIIMSTYYAAQLGIALSVVNSSDSPEINHRVMFQHSPAALFKKKTL